MYRYMSLYRLIAFLKASANAREFPTFIKEL